MQLIYAAYGVPEGGQRLFQAYQDLACSGLLPRTATIDGNPQQIKYLKKVWPKIILQRCIVHVQRQGLSWCRRKPKRTDAKHLRKIFLALSTVKSQNAVQRMKTNINTWERRFGPNISQSNVRGWVFSDLMRARTMILTAAPSLFHFVKNRRIPSSTNMLEGYFGRLKEHYRHHRGLAVHHRDAYFKWYFHFLPGKNSNTF